MPIIINSGDWFLRSVVQKQDWGPFPSEAAAWRHLFGRDSTNEERVDHERCGWSTFQVDDSEADSRALLDTIFGTDEELRDELKASAAGSVPNASDNACAAPGKQNPVSASSLSAAKKEDLGEQ